ncbi:hypothetical protein C9374_011380 [Naegleria lovaniensis]|uniref:Uncharacterized protein n=1 Tax=Naegleria lovaniensis TaxID=51637 RepID=A0AA88H0L6_NAELO|nr:uncharacterized protein C9374_011380 [Naegleria lovaniensis]KAG2392655.1 hypothetical protein C9374_011380 [Naegleria lovaniensis]
MLSSSSSSITTKKNHLSTEYSPELNMISTDDPSPSDLSQWINTSTSLHPNFEFFYPNTWKLDMASSSASLKIISPTQISPWLNQQDENEDECLMDQIRVDFTLDKHSHEEIHRETFSKLMTSYAISEYCEIEMLNDFQIKSNGDSTTTSTATSSATSSATTTTTATTTTSHEGNELLDTNSEQVQFIAKHSLVQYLSYGRIHMTRHHVVTVSALQPNMSEHSFYIFSYLTETGCEKNFSVFEKFLRNFKFPQEGTSTFLYELSTEYGPSILLHVPFPYQVSQKREGSLTIYTPQHVKYSSNFATSLSSVPRQMHFDFQYVKSNGEMNVQELATENFNSLTQQIENMSQLDQKPHRVKILQPVTLEHVQQQTSHVFSYEHDSGEDEKKFVEKHFTLLSNGDFLASSFANSITQDIQPPELLVFRKMLETFVLSQFDQQVILDQQLSEFNVAIYGENGVGKSTLISLYLYGCQQQQQQQHDGELNNLSNTNNNNNTNNGIVRDHTTTTTTTTTEEQTFRKYVPKSDSHSAFVLNILDTCGSDEFEKGGQFEKATRADAVILVCAADQPSSIEKLETIISRIERLKKRKVSEIPSLIVFNKVDMENAAAKSEEAKKLADQFGITFIECTIKKLSKVIDIFEGALIAELHSKQYVINRMQSDQQLLSEDVENFQSLIIQNQMEEIESLISTGSAPSMASEYLNLPIIFYAADSGVDENILKRLIEYNEQCEKFNLKNFTTKDGMNLALFAVSKGNLKALKLLENYGITLDTEPATVTLDNLNILAHIISVLLSEPDNDIVSYLLEKYEKTLSHFVNTPFKDEENLTSYPIHIAAKSGSTYAVKWLLNHGALQTINEKDAMGLTPLLFAVAEGNDSLVELLLESGAKISEEAQIEFFKENCPEDKFQTVVACLGKYGVKVE